MSAGTMATKSVKVICVVGAGTGVGKTFVGAGLVAVAAARGLPCRGLKPIESGVGAVAEDAMRLGEAAGVTVAPRYGFPAAVSPHRAARQEGVAISLDDPSEGPFVVVTREGRFVTCLGAGMRQHGLGLGVGLGHRRLGVLARIADQGVALIEDVLSVVEFARDGVLDVVEEFEHVTARHDAARGHRHTPRLLDNRHEFVESLKYPVHSHPNPALACLQQLVNL